MNLKLNPSGPGALKLSHEATTISISSLENLALRKRTLFMKESLKAEILKCGPCDVIFTYDMLKEGDSFLLNLNWVCYFFSISGDVLNAIVPPDNRCKGMKVTCVLVTFSNPFYPGVLSPINLSPFEQ